MPCVSELVLQTSRGCTTSVVPRGDPIVRGIQCRLPAQNQPGPMHELSEGGLGGVAVHSKHAIRSCGGTTGSPRGTILVVQPLEVHSETQDTRYQPIAFRSSKLFYIEMVRFRTWVPYQNFVYKVPSTTSRSL